MYEKAVECSGIGGSKHFVRKLCTFREKKSCTGTLMRKSKPSFFTTHNTHTK